ncbi:hypothetical protein Tco_1182818 [Tanacetum coccineum]
MGLVLKIKAVSYDVCGSILTVDLYKVKLTHGSDNIKPYMKHADENGCYCFEVWRLDMPIDNTELRQWLIKEYDGPEICIMWISSQLMDDDKIFPPKAEREVDVNLPTPMLKPQSPLKEPSQENPPTTQSNHDSIQSHSLPLGDPCDTNVGQAFIPPQNVNQTQFTQPPFPHLLINPHVASVLHAQTLPSPQDDNQTQPLPSPSLSLSRKMLIDDIN